MTRPQVGDIIRFGEYGTAQAQHVLDGYTIGTDDGVIEGTMPNNGIVTITPNTSDQALNGFYAIGSKVAGAPVAFGSCTVNPTVTDGFRYYDGSILKQTILPYVRVTGLNFKPSLVLISHNNTVLHTAVGTSPNFPWLQDSRADKPQIYVDLVNGGNYDYHADIYLDGDRAYLNQGSFKLPVRDDFSQAVTFNWLAIGDTIL